MRFDLTGGRDGGGFVAGGNGFAKHLGQFGAGHAARPQQDGRADKAKDR